MESKDEKKRLEKLTKESFVLEKLTYADLLLLLQYNEQVHYIIRSLVQTSSQKPEPETLGQNTAKEELLETEATNTPELQSEPKPKPKPEPLYTSEAELFYTALAPHLDFLQAVQADQEVATLWLKKDETTTQSLVRLLARASQWDQLTELWDMFASRCKKQERTLVNSEIQLLQYSLACYNLTLNSRQAELLWPECPAAFDHQQHTRGTPQGEAVTAIWLPGLTNAAGKLQKKPLVATQ